MGRPRKIDSGLPERLFFKHGAYYYVQAIGGKSIWEPVGRDEAAAVAIAERLNALKDLERLQVLRASRAASEELRAEIMKRDGYRCVYCGSEEALGLDHIIPYVCGGATLPFNLVCSCADCNASKGMSDPRELVLILIGVREKLLTRALDLLDKTAIY